MKISGYFQLPQLIIFTCASIFTLEFNHIAMAQRACVRTDAGRVVCGNLVREDNQQRTAISNSSQVFEANGIKFELQRCVRSGKAVNCDVLITNLGDKDEEFYLFTNSSRLIAVSGDEFPATQVNVGKQLSSILRTKFVSQIPIKASFSFEAVPQNMSKLALVEIAYSGQSETETAQFRNVVINPR